MAFESTPTSRQSDEQPRARRRRAAAGRTDRRERDRADGQPDAQAGDAAADLGDPRADARCTSPTSPTSARIHSTPTVLSPISTPPSTRTPPAASARASGVAGRPCHRGGDGDRADELDRDALAEVGAVERHVEARCSSPRSRCRRSPRPPNWRRVQPRHAPRDTASSPSAAADDAHPGDRLRLRPRRTAARRSSRPCTGRPPTGRTTPPASPCRGTARPDRGRGRRRRAVDARQPAVWLSRRGRGR